MDIFEDNRQQPCFLKDLKIPETIKHLISEKQFLINYVKNTV